MISEEEWQKYIRDRYSNVQYCHPKKEDIENFLEWREKNGEKITNKA